MDSKKAFILLMGVVFGMVFVLTLDVFTKRFPARLQYHFVSWKVARYDVKAKVDLLTMLEKQGRKVPVRYVYTEEMDLNFYYYHAPRTGQLSLMMERLTRKITPESITVDGKDETKKHGPAFAKRLPAPWYEFQNFNKHGMLKCQRHRAEIRDMIFSTYCIRHLPKKIIYTGDTWSGEKDMGALVTTYTWEFENLLTPKDSAQLARVTGYGEFFDKQAGGGKGTSQGTYTFSYTLGIGRKEGYIRQAQGTFDLHSRELGAGASYREEFTQDLISMENLDTQAHREMSAEITALKEVFTEHDMGDAKAFHNGLVAHLRAHRDSPLWENLLDILNDLRVKNKLKPVDRDKLLKGEDIKRPED
jgi:hypothetical protein